MSNPIEFRGDSFTVTAELYEHSGGCKDAWECGPDYIDIKLTIVPDDGSTIELDCMTCEVDGIIELLEKIKLEQAAAYERLSLEEAEAQAEQEETQRELAEWEQEQGEGVAV